MIKIILLSLGAVLAVVGVGPIVLHSETPYTVNNMPENLIGTWEGSVKSYYYDGVQEDDQALWPKISITFNKSGDMEGTVAIPKDDVLLSFTSCHAKKNRGAVLRKMNFFTDYIVRGDIETSGNSDPRKMSMPFNIKDGALQGTIFMSKDDNIKLYPEITRLQLRKINH